VLGNLNSARSLCQIGLYDALVRHPAIQASGIRKAFGEVVAVDDGAVTVAPGELVALLGPSGSGKTTLLRVIAGLEVPDDGTVAIDGRVVTAPGEWVEPEQRRVGMVFQDGALFPHLTVEANVAFGEPAPGRVASCLDLVGLADRARAYPHELSGGERQRVALARALAPEPDVILLDEPFASLDAALRTTLREEVASILREAGASALLVTHDQQEAMSLADAVVVMRDGAVVQAGTPEDLYDHPTSRWAAEFLGDAEVVPGDVVRGEVTCDLGTFAAVGVPDGIADVVVRPESLAVSAVPDGPVPAGSIRARVVHRTFFGHDHVLELELEGGQRVQSRGRGVDRWKHDELVLVRVDGPVTVLPTGATPQPAS
jgi:iron(III) transport system ATP-binding protein